MNPDRLTERFGYYVQHEDFSKGLEKLVDRGAWRGLGEAGRRYVANVHNIDKVIGGLIKELEELR